MMTVSRGDLRVFQFPNRFDVFVPTSDEEVVRFYRMLHRDLPRRFVLRLCLRSATPTTS